MTDSLNDLIALQYTINQIIYDSISIGYTTAVNTTDITTAIGLVVSAISTNLGIVIAQIPEEHRNEYIEIAKDIFDKSLNSSIKSFDEKKWGQIGHA